MQQRTGGALPRVSSAANNRSSMADKRRSQTELRIFDAFRDPAGVASRPLAHVVKEEIATATTAGGNRKTLSFSAGSAKDATSQGDKSSSSAQSQAASSKAGPVVVPYSMPHKPASEKPSRTMRDALQKLCQPQNSSSAALMASHLAAMRGPQVIPSHSSSSSSSGSSSSSSASFVPLSKKAKKALTLRRRADDARVQQLRGIFAGHDSDRDGHLGEEDLVAALLGLGIEPQPKVMALFERASETLHRQARQQEAMKLAAERAERRAARAQIRELQRLHREQQRQEQQERGAEGDNGSGNSGAELAAALDDLSRLELGGDNDINEDEEEAEEALALAAALHGHDDDGDDDEEGDSEEDDDDDSSDAHGRHGRRNRRKGKPVLIKVDLEAFVSIVMHQLPELSARETQLQQQQQQQEQAAGALVPAGEEAGDASSGSVDATAGLLAATGSAAASASASGAAASSSSLSPPFSTQPHCEELLCYYDSSNATLASTAVASSSSSVASAGSGSAAAAAPGAVGAAPLTGTIPLSSLLHVLCEVEGPSSLGVEEVADLLTMSGIAQQLQEQSQNHNSSSKKAKGARRSIKGDDDDDSDNEDIDEEAEQQEELQVDYHSFLRLLAFPLPKPKEGPTTGASSATPAKPSAGSAAVASSASKQALSAPVPGSASTASSKGKTVVTLKQHQPQQAQHTQAAGPGSYGLSLAPFSSASQGDAMAPLRFASAY